MGKDLTGETFGWLTVLYPTRKSNRKAWHCRCKCGNEVDVITNNLTSGHTKSCGCYNSLSRIKDITNQRFGRLKALYPTEKRSGTNVVWHCLCDCGNEVDVSAAHLGKTIFSCGCYRKECARDKGIKQIPDLLGSRFGKLVVINKLPDDQLNDKRWECQCDCGNIIYCSTNELRSNHISSCGCLKSSKCELFLEQIFNEYQIDYLKEYSFNDCLSIKGYKLRFDFYLPNYNLLIEYDGIQHTKPTYGIEVFASQQENDKIKDEYCISHDISLIRVPYTYNTYSSLKTFIAQTILTRCKVYREGANE